MGKDMQERIKRAGLSLTERGVKLAKHTGKRKLIAEITEGLAKLTPADLLTLSVIVSGMAFEE